jgi:PST family polysaccharide transporter
MLNSAWLMADKVVRLGTGLVVWVWLARSFGPEGFGLWSYATAFAALFGAVATLGLDGIVVRELLGGNHDEGELLGTALTLRLVAACIALIAALVCAYWQRDGQRLPVLLVALNALCFLFQCSQVFDYHFQAKMNSRPSVVAANGAFLFVTAARLGMLFLGASIAWFGATLVAESALTAALLTIAYRRDHETPPRWRVSGAIARHLLKESWPLLLSSLAVMAYMRLDQVMLSAMVGDEAVGQFSAALRIAEVWYFIPMSIMTATFPAMMRRRTEGSEAYERYVQTLYDGMAWLGIGVAVAATLLAPVVLPLLYGPKFVETPSILAVQIWAGVTVSMSFVHGKWLLAEGLQRYGLLYTVLGAVVNVSLNLLLIPRLGAIGAAWATLATQIGLLPVQLLLPKARRNFLLMINAFTAPLRLLREAVG